MAFNPNDYLIKLKGKDYLEVKYRLVWFNEVYPLELGWQLITECEYDDGEKAKYKASLINPEGKIIRTGTKVESKKDFFDYVEKAETGAVGRCLGMAGFGTQFAPEFDESDTINGDVRVVDSPVERKSSRKNDAPPETPQSEPTPEPEYDGDEPVGRGLIKTCEFMARRLKTKKIDYDLDAVIKDQYGKDKIEDLTKREADEIIQEMNELLKG